MRKIGIIGATGSIGSQAIDIIEQEKDDFQVIFLTAHNQLDKLIKIGKKVNAKHLVLTSERHHTDKVLTGIDELLKVIENEEIDIILSAAVGFSGLIPTYCALKKGIDIALANKESMVAAGRLLNETAKKNDAKIIPVDSEHSAVYQCLLGHDTSYLEKIILTASGGPFRNRPIDSFEFISVEEALNHPNWSMGRKITVDSATMMNKGLELIEARFLFNVGHDKLDVVIHPESIIHSIVAFCDGSYLAQMGVPDMKIPISYAISYPERVKLDIPRLNFFELKKLTFIKPDFERYPCLRIAMEALKIDKNSIYIALNAANEVAVDAFLKEVIKFNEIPMIIERTIEDFPVEDVMDIEEIVKMDKLAREKSRKLMSNII
ncbi:1-deoxy-D-xylulose-5-phosphate reductoisomerase [Deferribacter autotrophicus]|uniref:1-deoxy-D-xylulose 5-phosphate reductoisomerase n=1 Tax=Deferribacter autotrophicus TaxID=500465 RepID=A0A5A8F1G4_9BACT|nr:1-deoxy-D-xylulose-5-phosphate reductoisomerase [Deferribacter autotrophicus]KAA0257750.1 1-deoxy-D-xylulose-5-phosphate reductoisomerase [Deferribacter autotrophicus]